MNKETQSVVNFTLNHYNIDLSVFESSYLKKIIRNNMTIHMFESVNDYIKLLKNDPEFFAQLMNSFYNSHSKFFRYEQNLNVLYHHVLPRILKKMKSSDELRIWSLGCSKGQEPYSLAIMLEEYMKQLDFNFQYRIFGSDILSANLDFARNGVYSEKEIGNLTLDQVKNYFDKSDDDYRISSSIKNNVSFSQFNILSESKYPSESIYGGFDIIFCSNLLIYYNKDIQNDIIEKLQDLMKSSSYLVTSYSERESLNQSLELKNVKFSSSVFIKE